MTGCIAALAGAKILSPSPGPPTATPNGNPSVAVNDFNVTELLLDELELIELLLALLDTLLLDELLLELLERLDMLLLDAPPETGVELSPPPPLQAASNTLAPSKMPNGIARLILMSPLSFSCLFILIPNQFSQS